MAELNMDNTNNPTAPPVRTPTDEEMRAVFSMCRQNRWNSVLDCIRSNALIPITSMIMDNHISTTILHQAITSKGDTKSRARVIREILAVAPKAAAIKNGYGSLPLHVISQRNTKLDAPTKELLISEMVHAYKGALVEQGGVGKRTPLHIIFTDYISPRITEMMVKYGSEACFMKDKKGYLPAHVACSRHCSPEKLHMLLRVNKDALTTTTNAGETLLGLAIQTATRSHPNYALIDDLKRRLEEVGLDAREEVLVREDKSRRMAKLGGASSLPTSVPMIDPYGRRPGRHHRRQVSGMPRALVNYAEESDEEWTPAPIVTPLKADRNADGAGGGRKRKRLPSYCYEEPTEAIPEEKDENLEDPANLLLNISRQYSSDNKKIKLVASV